MTTTPLGVATPAHPRAEAAHPPASTPTTGDPWWRSAVVYQVYPRSFADSNGDGIGDIRGIIDHLDHIADLHIDVVWLSPVYRSPQDDNGYDISDYQDVDPTFGTLGDLDDLIDGLHQRGIKFVMDLVVNHTSDEHDWFRASSSNRDNDYADWYIWRDPRPGTIGGQPGAEPNNWGSFFSGPAWTWEPRRNQYYLHLFSAKQPDLNWDNPQVRAAVFQMMNWWLDRGVDGFRMDVINYISKDPALPDGTVDATGFGDGMPFFGYGPHVHDYLAEMQQEVFARRPGTYLTVGEMPGVTPEQALRFTDRDTGQLNMVFQFEHMDLDHVGSKWNVRDAAVVDLKNSLGRWQSAMTDRGWNSLYWSNHDQPRVVSRFGNDRDHWYHSATALAAVLHLHRGTPFIYQGEEIGMTNVPFTTIADFRDIETLNFFHDAVINRGLPAAPVLAAFRRKSRDNARAPMQWTSGPSAGFTTGSPWIPVNQNHDQINAEHQHQDPASVYAFYRQLVDLRHTHHVIVDGDFTMLVPEDPAIYAYRRSTSDDELVLAANLSDSAVDHPDHLRPGDGWRLLLSNCERTQAPTSLAPWEVCVYHRLRSHHDSTPR